MEDLASSSAMAHGDGSSRSVTTDNALVQSAPSHPLQQQNANDDPSILHARRRNQLGPPKLLRPLTATVLDLHLLDEYLLKGFMAPTLEQTLYSLVVAVNNNNNTSNSKLNQWIRTWTLPLLGTFTLLWSHGQLPTTRALGLAMVHRRSAGNRSRAMMRLLAYAALRYGLPALYQTLRRVLQQRERQLEEWRTRSTSPTTSSPSPHDQHFAANDPDEKRKQQQQCCLALQRQCTVLSMVLDGVDRILPCLRLACLVQCWAGWSTTPDPAMVLTGWEYHATNLDSSNLFNTQYAHRRWLWEQGWETLQLWLAGMALVRSTWSPWIEAQVVRPVAYMGRRLQSAISAYHPNHNQRQNSHCPLCRCRLAATAVLVQAQPCGHLYCYVCLYRASTSTTSAAPDATHPKKFSCHVCGTGITSANPV